jgi:hypothetical protein
MIASVINPAVRKKSAKAWCVIFCHAPNITIAAPIHTITLTILSVDFETPAMILVFLGLGTDFKFNTNGYLKLTQRVTALIKVSNSLTAMVC